MKLKICGINDADFAVHAASLGVDYLGFIFHPASPRNISPDLALQIRTAAAPQQLALSSVPRGARDLAVGFAAPLAPTLRFASAHLARGTLPAIRTAAAPQRRALPRLVGVFVSQSPSEILAIMRFAGLDVIQLHRRATPEEVAYLRSAGYEVWTLAGGAPGDGVLFDSSHGDGERDFRKGAYKSILAGKIGVDNLQAALSLAPDILDVNSSLETSPGVKDVSRLNAFIAAFRATM